MKRWLSSFVIAVAFAGCYGGEDAAGGGPGPSPSFHVAPLLIEHDDGSVLLDAERADTPEERRVGLRHRRSLDDDGGMLFLFFEETSGGFWMKNTRIPLSIAFFDEEGEILSILDMAPCRRGPCRTYDPGEPYWGALEVNRGAFDRWGVEPGDVIHTNA